MANNGMNISVGVVNNAKAGLTNALNDFTKFNQKAIDLAVINVRPNIDTRSFNKLEKDFLGSIKKIKSGLKKFSFEGIFSSPTGAKLREVEIGFDAKSLKNLDLATLKTYQSTLTELYKKLNANQAVGNSATGTWTAKETKNLGVLLNRIDQAIAQYNVLQKTANKAARLGVQLTGIDALRFNYKNAGTIDNEMKRIKARQAALVELIKYYQKLSIEEKKSNQSSKAAATDRGLARLRRMQVELMTQERMAATNHSTRLRQEREIGNEYVRQGGLLRNLSGLLTRYFSIFTVAHFGKKLAEMTGFFERQKVALEGIVGSAAEANKLMNQIKDFALQSPLEAKDLIQYVKQLSAYQIPTKDLFETTKMLADLSQGLGVSMDRLILAYGQVRSASVLRGQELRQFTEAGIPLVAKLAEKFSELRGEMVSTADVFKLISERTVPFEMVDEILRDMTAEGGKFNNMQERLSQTVYGQMQKIKDIWNQTLDTIGKRSNGLVMGIIGLVQSAARNIAAIVKGLFSGGIVVMITRLPVIMIGLVQKMQEARVQAALLKLELRQAGSAMQRMKLVAQGLSTTLSAFSLAAGVAIGAITMAIASAAEESRKFKQELREIDNSYSSDNQRLADGLDKIHRKLQKTTKGTKEYEEAISSLKSNYSDYINVTNDVIDIMNGETRTVNGLALSYNELRESITGAINAKNKYNRDNDTIKKYGSRLGTLAVRDWRSVIAYERVSGLSKTLRTSQTHDIVEDAIRYAFEELAENKSTKSSDLSEYIKEYLEDRINDISPDALEKLLGRIEGAFGRWKATSPTFKKYVAEIENFNNSETNKAYEKINQAFDDISPVGENNIERYKDQQKKALKTLRGLLIDNEVIDVRQKIGGADLLDEIDEALKNFDYNKIEQITKSFGKLISTLNVDDKTLATTILGQFQLVTESLDKRSALVKKRIEDNFQITDKASKDYNAFAHEMFNGLNAENYQQRRERVKEEHENAKKSIAGYLGTGTENITLERLRKRISEDNKDFAELSRLVKLRDTSLILMGDDYFRIKEKEKSGKGSGSIQVPAEVSDFINRLKDAYTTYKTAAQSEGGALGIAYMQNDAKMIEKFANLFAAGMEVNGHNIFKDENGDDITINGKPISDILKDKFITAGLENGVADFSAAIEAVAAELEAVGNKGKGYKQFLTAAKELRKWWEQTSSKDNVQGWIAEVDKALQDLNKTFSQSTQQVELYRKLLQNGTANTLSDFIGNAAKSSAYTPDSLLQLANIQQMVDKYNELLNTENAINNTRLQPFSLDLTRMKNVGDIQAAIATITAQQKLNKYNFAANPALGNAGKQLETMLNQYLTTIIKELESISGERYTGDRLADAIANAQKKSAIAREIYKSAEANAFDKGTFDAKALAEYHKALQENAQGIFDQFLQSNNFEALTNAGKKFGRDGVNLDVTKQKLQKIIDELIKNGSTDLADELKTKMEDLEIKVKEFNAESGDMGAIFQNLQDYRNAHNYAQEQYNTKVGERDSITNNLSALQSQRETIQNYINANPSLDTELLDSYNSTLAEINLKIEQCNIDLAQSNAELERMGENGILLEKKLKLQALQNVQKAINKSSSSLNSMKDAVNGVVNSAKALSKAINKTYDVMHDGENPDWMSDMDEFLSDFEEAFEALIAPITAVIAMLYAMAVAAVVAETAMTPLLVVMLAIIAAAAIIAGIIAAFQQHDRQLEHQIEDLQEQIDNLQRTIDELEFNQEFMTQSQKLKSQTEEITLLYEQQLDMLKQARKEEEKKNTDEEKKQEYIDAAIEKERQALEIVKDIREEVVGTADDLASRLTDSLVDAFRNGTNAARAWRDQVKQYMSDMLKQQLLTNLFAPQMQVLMDNLLGGTAEEMQSMAKNKGITDYNKYIVGRLSDVGLVEDYEKGLVSLGDAMIDVHDALPDTIKDLIDYNSQLTSLSGGIESVTEDTARRLEALSNSQLGEQLMIRVLLQQYLPIFADNGTQMATIQSAITEMRSDVGIIALMSQRIERHFNDVRYTQANPINVRMVS